jgi:hypothetical protein
LEKSPPYEDVVLPSLTDDLYAQGITNRRASSLYLDDKEPAQAIFWMDLKACLGACVVVAYTNDGYLRDAYR